MTYSLLRRKATTVARPVGVSRQYASHHLPRQNAHARYQGTGRMVNRMRSGPFELVTTVAGRSKILSPITPAHRLRDDVIDH
jgi:hypothetical protein